MIRINDELIFIITAVCILLSALNCLLSKNILNAVLWFLSICGFTTLFLIQTNAQIIGIVLLLTSISLASVFLIIAASNGKHLKNETFSRTKFILLLLFWSLLLHYTFSKQNSNFLSIETGDQDYSQIMSILSVIFYVIFSVTFFKLDVISSKRR
ncbi:MAG: hypothetical protein LBI26_00205 [Holosporales bacterium]|jgi:NADH:ubiquinone oxidoreductase subunit 6 (subunit J)|nr:hypothetical protein [Holosporales bacterium]